jgi:hypothetical protein
VRVALLALVALALAGCGGERTSGRATRWVTREAGARVLYTGSVPAGLNAIQALERVRKVTTRYGGRYVQSIDGVAGSLSSQHDWFLFVNGVESGTGGADVRLRPGDVEWWDYRSWAGGQMTVPVVAGAFPEPFLHGFQWAKPGATVVYRRPADAAVARRLAHEVGGRTATAATRGNAIEILAGGNAAATISRVADRVRLVLTPGLARRLASDPAAFRFRYTPVPG